MTCPIIKFVYLTVFRTYCILHSYLRDQLDNKQVFN